VLIKQIISVQNCPNWETVKIQSPAMPVFIEQPPRTPAGSGVRKELPMSAMTLPPEHAAPNNQSPGSHVKGTGSAGERQDVPQMSRRCPVDASYLIRYGTSMRHVRGIPSASRHQMQVRPIFINAESHVFLRLKGLPG
jgi:hypothetical protein